MVTLSLTLAIGLLTMTFQGDIFALNDSLSANLTTQGQLRGALRIMTTQIRMASPANTGAYPIAEADGSRLTFYADTDGDGVRERIRYFLDGTTLRQGTVKPAGDPLAYSQDDETLSDIAHHVRNAATVFAYYDSTYDGTTAPLSEPIDIPAVRLIRLNLSVEPPDSRRSAPLTMTSVATLRNLKGL